MIEKRLESFEPSYKKTDAKRDRLRLASALAIVYMMGKHNFNIGKDRKKWLFEALLPYCDVESRTCPDVDQVVNFHFTTEKK